MPGFEALIKAASADQGSGCTSKRGETNRAETDCAPDIWYRGQGAREQKSRSNHRVPRLFVMIRQSGN
ncbi:MAG: hypothetical protein CSB48_14300 [Proteobacteria bacterium]|nr:MAG: hypothetical protein CSB48_14300 [Pseudomonadota bacterium]